MQRNDFSSSGVVDGPAESLLRCVRAVDADKDLLHHG